MPFNPQSILLDSRFAVRVEQVHIDWFNGRCSSGDLTILADGSVALDDDAGSCESCDDRILSDGLVSVTVPRRVQGYGSRRPSVMWCAPCVRREGFECPDCRETFHQDLSCGLNASDESVCESCAENYFCCEGCNATCNNDDYGEDGHCRSCSDSDSSANIKPYSFKDYGSPIGKGPLFFGVELEVEAGDNRDSAAQDISSSLEGFAVLKEDGSIKSGFEIVTRPASMDEQRKGWKGFFTDLPDGLLSYKTETCGLHVHASRSAMTPLQISKIVCFVNSPENREFVERIAGRKACDWAKYHGKKLPLPVTVPVNAMKRSTWRTPRRSSFASSKAP